jgi:exopolyphosphatase/guanosine-5'-triphosphate,3'-diphosphate pyrophosphatase
MVIARLVGGEPVVLDRLREPVRLAGGLRGGQGIGPKAQARALACLERFGQRLRSLEPERVRAVGTNALRAAKKPTQFLAAAERALGHPIEVISGAEEARLIYLGVAHALPDDPGPRLVVDIGGGSTEVILGEGFEPLEVHSLDIGCVGLSRRFFRRGEVTKDALQRAVLAARQEVQTLEQRFREIGWVRAVGASGTIRATAEVLRANGWADGTVTSAGLKRLRKARAASVGEAKGVLAAVDRERLPVYPGGLTVLFALFEGLGIESMETSSQALREGVVYDLLGRIRHEDVRERTIRAFQERYHVDRAQAARVERRALQLLLHAASAWGLDAAEAGRVLAWAARLHEIGLAVSYGRHQRHGAYLIENSDMPGFSRDEQRLLAALVGAHRRKVAPDAFDRVPPPLAPMARRLAGLLRLAVVLHRGRNPQQAAPLRLEAGDGRLRLSLPAAWLEAHALTRIDLEGERKPLAQLGLALEIDASA